MSDYNEMKNGNQKKVSRINGIFGLISFSTILPLNIHTSIEEMAKFTWIWPMIGALIGIIVGTFGFLLVDLLHLPILIAAALIYSFSIWFTGFHHLDGLVDFGDGMMVHGSPEKKIDVMRDKRIGTGGIVYLLMVGLVTFAAIGSAPAVVIFYIILVSEMAAKMGIVTCATFSQPFPDGTGRSFIESMNKKILLVSFILTSAVGFLVFNTAGIIGITIGILAGVLIAFIAKKNFKWATGDVLGTSNEIARMLALVIMVAFLSI
jgi:adenosylcobinamide-GDP ribazoletransferase